MEENKIVKFNNFKYNLIRIPGFNTPDKTLLSINGQAICVANGKDRCEKLSSLLQQEKNLIVLIRE